MNHKHYLFVCIISETGWSQTKKYAAVSEVKAHSCCIKGSTGLSCCIIQRKASDITSHAWFKMDQTDADKQLSQAVIINYSLSVLGVCDWWRFGTPIIDRKRTCTFRLLVCVREGVLVTHQSSLLHSNFLSIIQKTALSLFIYKPLTPPNPPDHQSSVLWV